MKLNCVARKCKLLNIEKNDNNGIEWYSAVFMQDNNVNSNVTVDKDLAPDLKPMQIYDFVVSVSENPKAYRNGTGAYIDSKFKIIGLDGVSKEGSKTIDK